MTVKETTRILALIVATLLGIGLVMLASASGVRAETLYSEPYFFIKRQFMWLGVALCAGFVLIRVDYHLYYKLAIPFALLSLTLLALVFVPGVGVKVGGSHRWLSLGPLRMQPSEFAKLAMVIAMAAWMSRYERRATEKMIGLIWPGGGLAVCLVFLIAEPDFGTTLLVGMVGMMLMFAGGTRLSHLAIAGGLGAAAFTAAIMQDPVRLVRILAFLFPEKYPDSAYHLMQSKLAFIRGGVSGVGIGNSIQKHFYLPEAHTDFILAIIGEEQGLLLTGFVLLMFVGILLCGLKICVSAPETFGRLLAFGLTMLVVTQAAINIGVVTGCLPTKGLPLPFISYGGTSLLVSVMGMAVLANIGMQGVERRDDPARAIKDQEHGF